MSYAEAWARHLADLSPHGLLALRTMKPRRVQSYKYLKNLMNPEVGAIYHIQSTVWYLDHEPFEGSLGFCVGLNPVLYLMCGLGISAWKYMRALMD